MKWAISLFIGAILSGLPFDGRAAAQDQVISTSRTVDDDLANEAARQTFLEEAYWWKRSTNVKSTTTVGDLLSYIFDKLVSPVLTALQEGLVWLLDKLLGELRIPIGNWSGGIPFLWVIIFVIAAVATWMIIRMLQVPLMTKETVQSSTIVHTLAQADHLLEQARAALLQGDRRNAIRLAFLSLIAWLQHRGQLKYDPSRSNREYQRDLRRFPDSVTSFRSAAVPFERCWYGGRDLGVNEIQDVITMCQLQFQAGERKE